ncbi:MAG: Ig-like domain-containing protein [Muribaculaceae bacterium]|nr:Ig-like domain-containing protein [Muribaculaceae bacterium]
MQNNNHLRLLPVIAATALLVTACASLGRPDGGPRDEMPPRFIGSNPMPGSTNFDGKKIVLTFDENVQMDNPSEKLVVSPPQQQQPAVLANGRHVTITLRDTLIPNTTYTVDLSDGVKDLNEGNILDGMAIDFSTGPSIDTLRISGMVLEARTLEPAQGMLVGVYATDADSAITTLRMERIAKTNQLGQFTVRNLKPGRYQIFALTDVNRDFHWDRTEDVAFCDSILSPSASAVMLSDTFLDSSDRDSVVTRQGVRYLPDDVLLTWFNEGYVQQYLKEYSRPDRRKISLQMATKADSLPRLTVVAMGSEAVNIPLSGASVLERNLTADTLSYWITDTALIRSDSLLIATTYRRVDSVGSLVWATDTLKFFNKRPRGKKAIEDARRVANPRTLQQKIDSVHAISDTLAIDTFALSQPDSWLDVKITAGQPQDVHRPVGVEFSEPVMSIDPSGIHLEIDIDSVWTPVSDFHGRIVPADSVTNVRYRLDYKWTPEAHYRLTVDSLAVRGLLSLYSNTVSKEFTVKSLDEYSTIVFNITGLDSIPAIVELLNPSDVPVASAPVGPGGRCVLNFIAPGSYFARLYLDADHSGTYTVGSISERRQPEETYYFPKKINLKKNWYLEQAWNIYELPLDLQKPAEVKKNKPRDKDGNDVDNGASDDEEEEDLGGFGETGFGRDSRYNPNNFRKRY